MPSFQIPQCCSRPMTHTRVLRDAYWECLICRTRKNKSGKVIQSQLEDMFADAEPTMAEQVARMP